MPSDSAPNPIRLRPLLAHTRAGAWHATKTSAFSIAGLFIKDHPRMLARCSSVNDLMDRERPERASTGSPYASDCRNSHTCAEESLHSRGSGCPIKFGCRPANTSAIRFHTPLRHGIGARQKVIYIEARTLSRIPHFHHLSKLKDGR